MQYRTDTLGLSDSVNIVLRDLIHEHLGLFYEAHQFDQLGDRLAPLVVARGLRSFMDYYYLLKYTAATDEWLKVMDALSVQETYFWREIDQIRAVVDHVVPELARTQIGRPIRIWSIPCATGEEPLTIAMLLSEAGLFDRVSIEIVGSDASPMAIERARAGHYTQRSFRNLPRAMQAKYFEQHGNVWTIIPSLHRRVSYDVVNLMAEDQVARHAFAPIVFCRNVFIYFSDHSIRRVLRVFERLMPTPGYLCVGAAESLLRRTSTFDLREIGGAFVYVKDASSAAQPAAAPPVERAS